MVAFTATRPDLKRANSIMMHQAPMLSAPLKQTNEIDWITPLKGYIRDSYGDDPNNYMEECVTLNRLRQDMRGAGKDSASGRDLLYRYYGQLELLDLRFPVDENHIRISFTWFDAFTLKPTAQYSLAYEKASIIFNISAVLSCHAAAQNRHEESGLKTAYHSFQAAAGMFTYINENFLHAPSQDLSRETVKCLIHLMLAQGQEVFLEKQVADQKKDGLLAKLASQAAYLYGQALEGVQENVGNGVFERVWLLLTQVKANHMASTAQYYQALADNDANAHGIALCRLQVAETQAKEALKVAGTFPAAIPPISNLTSETSGLLADIAKRQLAAVQERFAEFSKDNDFIYHQPIPGESTLQSIPKLPAAKAIPVSELYQGQDIQRIIGPDIFQRIVPMAVTESASLYDEEKAKLVRAETERVELANGELEASLDYLKLPHSLNILKGGQDSMDLSIDPEFRRWCESLSGHQPFTSQFEQLTTERNTINTLLDQCVKSLDTEESVCEKMRSKYGDDWTQLPSSRLTATLRADTRNYRQVIEEAGTSDAQLYSSYRTNEADFEEMRSAGETDEADVLYQRALIKAGVGKGKTGSSKSPFSEGNLLDDDFDNGPTVADQISHIEDLVKKVQLVRKEREQVLKDLRERVHNDDISSTLILNKKALTSDSSIFKSELEKFRPHTNRILQANHKQTSLLKELTRSFDTLLTDKRIRVDQQKYEAVNRGRTVVLQRYKRVHGAYTDLVEGLRRARGFYGEMRETVGSLKENVEGFVGNRRNEGSLLLAGIEALRKSKGAGAGGSGNTSGLVDWERGGVAEMMGRMSVEPNRGAGPPPPQQQARPGYGSGHSAGSFGSPAPGPGGYASPPPPPTQQGGSGNRPANIGITPYNPNHHQPLSPPLQPPSASGYNSQPLQPNNRQSLQEAFSALPQQQQGYGQYANNPPPQRQSYQQQLPVAQQPNQAGMPTGWQPPPPPPGPPPQQGDYNFGLAGGPGSQGYPNGPGGYAANVPRQPSQQSQSQAQGGQADPWSGLSGWK